MELPTVVVLLGPAKSSEQSLDDAVAEWTKRVNSDPCDRTPDDMMRITNVVAAQIRIMLGLNVTNDPRYEIRVTLRLPNASVRFILQNAQ